MWDEIWPLLLGLGGGYSHRPATTLNGMATVLEEEFVHEVYRRHPEQVIPPGGNCAYRRSAWERGRTGRERQLRSLRGGQPLLDVLRDRRLERFPPPLRRLHRRV